MTKTMQLMFALVGVFILLGATLRNFFSDTTIVIPADAPLIALGFFAASIAFSLISKNSGD